ncbi:MAG: TerB family tellurite resistance protein [Cycloclasticus sp.]
MDFEILDLIDDASAEANAFENHPTTELGMEEQVLYLKGLALVMNVDKDIDASEKEYIRILIKSMKLDESLLDDVVAFSQSPDKDTVQAFFKAFRYQANAQVFVFDALTMAFRDDELKDVEKSAIDKIAKQLGVLKGVQQDIYDLFCHIKHNNWKESALYFNSHLLKVSQFQHLLTYYGVDYDLLMAETETLRQSRLQELISAKQVAASSTDDAETENTSNGSSALSHDVVIPMLQAELDRGLGHVVDGKLSIEAHSISLENDEVDDNGSQEVSAIEQFDLAANGIGLNQATQYLVSQEAKWVEDAQIGEYLRSKFLQGDTVGSVDYSNLVPTIVRKEYADDYTYITYHLSTPITEEIPLVFWDGHFFKYTIQGRRNDYTPYGSIAIFLGVNHCAHEETYLSLFYGSADGDCRGRLVPIKDPVEINKLEHFFQMAAQNKLPSELIFRFKET